MHCHVEVLDTHRRGEGKGAVLQDLCISQQVTAGCQGIELGSRHLNTTGHT